MDLTIFQRRWKNATGSTVTLGTETKRSRTLAMLAHFTAEEIDAALEQTVRSADKPGWGYFRAVLDSTDEPANQAGSTHETTLDPSLIDESVPDEERGPPDLGEAPSGKELFEQFAGDTDWCSKEDSGG